MMKKWFLHLTIIFIAGLLLMGCADSDNGTKEAEKETNNEQVENDANAEENIEKVEITISEDHGETTILEKEVAIEEDDILLDVMKENFEIEEQDGFITSIDGKAPAEGEQKSWMFFVNGEMGLVGAVEYELNQNDQVVFDLQAWE